MDLNTVGTNKEILLNVFCLLSFRDQHVARVCKSWHRSLQEARSNSTNLLLNESKTGASSQNSDVSSRFPLPLENWSESLSRLLILTDEKHTVSQHSLFAAIALCHDATKLDDIDSAPTPLIKLPALSTAINWLQSHDPSFVFYPSSDAEQPIREGENGEVYSTSITPVLSRIISGALSLPDVFSLIDSSLPVLCRGRSSSIGFTPRQVYSLLCHAFFCNLTSLPRPSASTKPDARFDGTLILPHYGSISLMMLYQSDTKIAAERTKCLINYFHQFFHQPELCSSEREQIVFKRLVYPQPSTSLTFWSEDESTPLAPVLVHTDGIEKSPASVHLDMANEDLHIGSIIPSCTQEEIIFNLRPELFVGLLFCQTMADNEAIVMKGSRMFNISTGFTSSFRFIGSCAPPSLTPGSTSDVLALDAMIAETFQAQLKPNAIVRDLTKLYLGFSQGVDQDRKKTPIDNDNDDDSCSTSGRGGDNTNTIATGSWGCGSFGCDPTVKFIQQIMAASKAGKALSYSAFQDPIEAKRLNQLYTHFCQQNMNISSLWSMLIDYDADRPSFGLPSSIAFARYARKINLVPGSPVYLEILEQEAEAEEQRHQKELASRKLCKGGCGWDLGSNNSHNYCSSCLKNNQE